MNYTQTQIAGIDCIFAHMPSSYSTTIEVMVKAGSRYETRKTNGISHFLEHMFFKGGKKYPTPHAVAKAIEGFGGRCNAYTSTDYAGYYIQSAPEHVLQACDVLSDMLVHAQFPAPELEREKGVVIQEIKMYEDDPQSLVHQHWKQRYHGDNSYGRNILGPEENVRSFDQDMLFAHQHALYTKDNMVIVVAGNIEDEQALRDSIATLFDPLPSTRSSQPPVYDITTRPETTTSLYEKGTQQRHMIYSRDGYDGTQEEKYAAKLLMTALGGNMSSRLFQRIREQLGLCYYIGAQHSTRPYIGTCMVYAGIDSEQFALGCERIEEEIDRTLAHGISEEEFLHARQYRLGSLKMGIETSSEMASFLGQQHLLYNNIETIPMITEKYASLDIQDILDVGKKLSENTTYRYHIQ